MISFSDVRHAEEHLVAVDCKEKTVSRARDGVEFIDDFLEILNSKPDFQLLVQVLRWLNNQAEINGSVNLKVPGPKTAQTVFVLVSETIPDYWSILNSGAHDKEQRLLLRCLKNASGIGVIVSQLRVALSIKENKGAGENSAKRSSQNISDLLSVLEKLMSKSSFLWEIWNDASSLISNTSEKNLIWKEYISYFAGGKILSVAAEANRHINELSSDLKDGSWLGIGNRFCSWLGHNTVFMLTKMSPDNVEGFKALAQFTSKILKLGYIGRYVDWQGLSLVVLIRGR